MTLYESIPIPTRLSPLLLIQDSMFALKRRIATATCWYSGCSPWVIFIFAIPFSLQLRRLLPFSIRPSFVIGLLVVWLGSYP